MVYKIAIAIGIIYILVIGILYFFQEKLIFFPQKTPKGYDFNFKGEYSELYIESNDGAKLNGVLFKAQNPKGLIFYLHGNGGTIRSWGEIAPIYTNLNYDLFILDYRSYGKSEGKITSQEQLFTDHQLVYNHIKTMYSENNIIVLGYSIGSGFAAKLASENKPKMLILQTPYYSFTDLMHKTYPLVPAFVLKYKLTTNEFLKRCEMPIILFHGTDDEVVYYQSSVKLHQEFKDKTTLITLPGQDHYSISYNPIYLKSIEQILSE